MAEKISVCILTFNSERTIRQCLIGASKVADEIVVVDSGSGDDTLNIVEDFSATIYHRAYDHHSNQMNYAISKATNSWVLCLDSDEFLDDETASNINNIKNILFDKTKAYRISREWHVLNKPIAAIYPVSSPDFPTRLFHREIARFNGEPVDDKVVGFKSREKIHGRVIHDTFYNINEVFDKLNKYTTRLNDYKEITPSLGKAILHPVVAFFKWYFVKKSYKDGKEGLVCGIYAAMYTFMKYFKAWYRSKA